MDGVKQLPQKAISFTLKGRFHLRFGGGGSLHSFQWLNSHRGCTFSGITKKITNESLLLILEVS